METLAGIGQTLLQRSEASIKTQDALLVRTIWGCVLGRGQMLCTFFNKTLISKQKKITYWLNILSSVRNSWLGSWSKITPPASSSQRVEEIQSVQSFIDTGFK